MVGSKAGVSKPDGSQTKLREAERSSLKRKKRSEGIASEPYISRGDDASGTFCSMENNLSANLCCNNRWRYIFEERFPLKASKIPACPRQDAARFGRSSLSLDACTKSQSHLDPRRGLSYSCAVGSGKQKELPRAALPEKAALRWCQVLRNSCAC